MAFRRLGDSNSSLLDVIWPTRVTGVPHTPPPSPKKMDFYYMRFDELKELWFFLFLKIYSRIVHKVIRKSGPIIRNDFIKTDRLVTGSPISGSPREGERGSLKGATTTQYASVRIRGLVWAQVRRVCGKEWLSRAKKRRSIEVSRSIDRREQSTCRISFNNAQSALVWTFSAPPNDLVFQSIGSTPETASESMFSRCFCGYSRSLDLPLRRLVLSVFNRDGIDLEKTLSCRTRDGENLTLDVEFSVHRKNK